MMTLLRHAISGCAVAALALTSTSAAAQAANTSVLTVNLAGWEAWGEFGDAQNSQAFFNIGAGSQVLGYSWNNLTFKTEGASWLGEFVLSVNNANGSLFMDAAPADGSDFSGVFGPANGTWGVNVAFAGAPFTVSDGVLWVTVYELFNDANRDALVSSGSLSIVYSSATVVPEPGTYGLVALGLMGVAVVGRRRKAGSVRGHPGFFN
jgi:hypothetical protein